MQRCMEYMSPLKEDVKMIFENLVGIDVSKVIEGFEDPEVYPKDFLEECEYFLANFIGMEAAHQKLLPLYKKYIEKN